MAGSSHIKLSIYAYGIHPGYVLLGANTVFDAQVTDRCTAISSSFLVTVMSTDVVIIKSVQQQHPVTTVHIVLPQDVDECNLIVNISVKNSAGMSTPTEITVGKLIATFPGSFSVHHERRG